MSSKLIDGKKISTHIKDNLKLEIDKIQKDSHTGACRLFFYLCFFL